MNPVSTMEATPNPADHEDIARQVASVIGPASAAAQALAELQRRRDAGEDVRIFSQHKSWFVCPALAAAPH